MKSKASYFSVSLPLITENMKRLWAIPVLGFLVYFFSGAFPIIMSYKKLNNMASYIEWSLHNLQPFYMMVHLLLPVVAAVVLFRYLQSTGSVAVMHSMPFTRSKLYNSNYLSGLILISLPILVNGIILLLLSKPTFNQWGPPEDRGISTIDVFTKMEVLNWIGTSLLIVVVLYSIAVFTGIVVGNSTMHAFASYYFIFLVPLLYAVFNVYFQEFLFGFDISGSWIESALSISPYTGILYGNGYFKLGAVLFYLFTILIMTLAGAVLYSKRKLEKASDALVFNFVKPFISYVVAFLGMTMLGFYFYMMGQSRVYMYAGFAAGTIIFFIIGSMVVEKTPRIYNRQGYKNFLIYSLIAILFIVGMNLDLTGFEKRVPKVSQVQAAEFYLPFDDHSFGGGSEDFNLESEDNLRALTDFHGSIVENKAKYKKDSMAEISGLKSSLFRMKYKTKTALPMSRRYRLDYYSYKDDPNLKKIFESKEYKDYRSFFGPAIKEYKSIMIYPEFYPAPYHEYEEDRVKEITDPVVIDEFMRLVEKDFQAMAYEDMMSLKPSYVSMELQYVPSNGEDKLPLNDRVRYMYFQISPTFKNTLKWIYEKGYAEEVTADKVDWIDIYPPRGERLTYEKALFTSAGDRGAIMTISDEAKIQKVLDNYDKEAINSDTAYEVNIIFKDDKGSAYGYLNNGINFLQ